MTSILKRLLYTMHMHTIYKSLVDVSGSEDPALIM